MFIKVLAVCAVSVVAAGQELGHHQHHQHGQHHAVSSQSIQRHDSPAQQQAGHGTHGHGHEGHHVDYYAHPKYEFEYKVEDLHTKDIKGQHEARDGDQVHGYYYLHQPDGHIRHVDYHANKHDGFHADVKFDTKHEHQHHH